jgi:hypothetical protein
MQDSVFKKMSKNDLGITKSHQAGIFIPKDLVRKGFFPELDSSQFNPRVVINIQCGEKTYFFNYIYYNNKLSNQGTRNEFRLTGMSKFFKQENIKEGDSLQFVRNDVSNKYSIVVHRQSEKCAVAFDSDSPLIIRSNWSY